MAKTLTEKQRKYIELVAAGKCKAQAAREAGYKRLSGPIGQLNRNARVQAAITELREERHQEAANITKTDLVAILLPYALRLETEDITMSDGKGGFRNVERRMAISNAIKANELIGKIKGYLQSNMTIESSGLPIVIKDDIPRAGDNLEENGKDGSERKAS